MVAPAQENTAPRTRPDNLDERRVRRLARMRREKRRFQAALGLALVFHLSMITIFEIVIPFPRNDPEYYNVSIVSSPASSPEPTSNGRTGDTLALSGALRFADGVPTVELPVIEFAELDRLRVRYDASEPLPDLDDFFEPARPADSWARFGGELHRLGRSLRDFALPGERGATVPAAGAQAQSLTHRPAEGFEAYIEWNTSPHDRELLFAPPIRALWEIRPTDLRRPLEIVFKVAPSGRVVNVWSPMIDEGGLIDDVQITVLQYRFAPLADYGDTASPTASSQEQSGVLFIRASENAP